MSDRRFLSAIFLIFLAFVIGSLCVSWAESAEPKSEWVQVSVQTDTSTNNGTGYYLGGGVVMAYQDVARGSVDMRAKVTFPCGKVYLGTIIFQDRAPNLCFIKLDKMPDLAARYHLRKRTDRFYDKVVGRYHQRTRTTRFYRRVV